MKLKSNPNWKKVHGNAIVATHVDLLTGKITKIRSRDWKYKGEKEEHRKL